MAAKKKNPAESKRYLLVMTDDCCASDVKTIREGLEEEWKRIWDGKPPYPILILPPTCKYAGIIE